MKELNDAASPLIANNKACVETCINTLRNSIEELERQNALEFSTKQQVSSLMLWLTNHKSPSGTGTGCVIRTLLRTYIIVEEFDLEF